MGQVTHLLNHLGNGINDIVPNVQKYHKSFSRDCVIHLKTDFNVLLKELISSGRI